MSFDKELEGVHHHLLMVSAAFQGHLNPTFKFAKRLVSKGLHVTLVTTEDARSRLLKSSSDDYNNNNDIELEFFSDGLSLDSDRSITSTFLHSLETKGAQNLSNLIAQSRKRFACIIINPFLPWASDVASSYGIPCAMLWFQASSVFSIYYRYAEKTNPFPDFQNPDETLDLPGFPVLQVRDLPTFILPSCPPHHSKLVWDFFQRMRNFKWIFGSSFLELEEEIVKSMNPLAPIIPIGPLVSPFLLGESSSSLESEKSNNLNLNLWEAQDSCLEFLDKNPPRSVIYVAFGSRIVLSQNQINNIALGLKNTKRPFLWVIRPSSNNDEKAPHLPHGFLEETKGRGHVVTWSPQEKVLMHPSIGCFVSHCGWNSTLEAVVAGVAVIGHPNWLDQPTNAKLVSDVFKNGVKMRFGEEGIVEAKEVERCVWEVMEGPKCEEIKKRVLELKVAARKALACGGSSDANIDRFVSEIVGKFD